MKLDKRIDWGGMQERAEKHFARRAAVNAAPRERMASAPCSDAIRESESALYAAAYQGRRVRDNALGAMRAEAMASRREANHDR